MQSMASIRGLPVSLANTVDTSGHCFLILAATSLSRLAFSTPGFFHHSLWARRAALTAASTSSLSQSLTVANRSSVAGFCISLVCWERESIQLPSMNIFWLIGSSQANDDLV